MPEPKGQSSPARAFGKSKGTMRSFEQHDELNRFDFERASRAEDGPYRLLGGKEFESPDLLLRREEVRRSPKLKSATLKFWQALGKAGKPGELHFLILGIKNRYLRSRVI